MFFVSAAIPKVHPTAVPITTGRKIFSRFSRDDFIVFCRYGVDRIGQLFHVSGAHIFVMQLRFLRESAPVRLILLTVEISSAQMCWPRHLTHSRCVLLRKCLKQTKYILPISMRNAAGMHITFSQFNLVSAS